MKENEENEGEKYGKRTELLAITNKIRWLS